MRQEAVQQALAAMQDKPKQVVPLPSKRASVARPVSAAPAEAEHEDMEDEDSELEDEHEVSCDWWISGSRDHSAHSDWSR